MRRVISIDPGLNHVAYAIWDPQTGKLLRAGLVSAEYAVGTERAQKWRDMADACDVELELSDYEGETWLVLEVPQVYSGPREEDPNDLIDLAGVDGAIIGRCSPGTEVQWSPQPREWKGQAPKRITQTRVDERLKADETICVEWPIKSLRHNVYDAIHLGIVYLEREGLREIPLPVRYPNKA